MNTTFDYYVSLYTVGDDAHFLTIGVNGTEAAYDAFHAACDFAKAAGIDCCDLVWGETGEVVAYMRDDDEDEDFDCDDADLECGFDPYEGDYTWDC